ncbi:beta-1,4-galactosyltransferase 1-like [Erpetoichthys calabaricus]|uniref:Beta-1,4-galactosyltransferase n=1 Tax=Erpetoichthys calabaricus TaxID=27687 RepID=A0A8C4TQ64_ERPCA|nr:beta-1,4-galactosyltransferase 1-like [Erpetoichthys calabaricus]
MSGPGQSCLQRVSIAMVFICALHLVVVLLYYFNTFQAMKTFIQAQQQHKAGDKRVKVTWELPAIVTSGPDTNSTTTPPPEIRDRSADLPPCPETPPHLVGAQPVEFSHHIDLNEVKRQNPEVRDGGRYMPKECKALQKVALIIPFRKREEHLKYWLYYLHPNLQRQQLDYGVYVIEQSGETMFNRAKLMNIGYAEALKEYDYDCFIFSDVDLIPMDDRNIYKCYSQPRHLSVSIDKFGFRLPYNQCFGGVSSFSKEQFQKINGFPNNYWGWGGEDDDLYNRITFRGMSLSRPDVVIGRYRMIVHERDQKNDPNPERFDRIGRTKLTMDSDGLNSLTYKVIEVQKQPLYTKVIVDVGSPSR